jgi:hypothetical protein
MPAIALRDGDSPQAARGPVAAQVVAAAAQIESVKAGAERHELAEFHTDVDGVEVDGLESGEGPGALVVHVD